VWGVGVGGGGVVGGGGGGGGVKVEKRKLHFRKSSVLMGH
jgi:hypothetical protein